MPLPFEPFALSVPASSANLGPGFDTIALALERRMYARVEPASSFELSFAPGLYAPTHSGISDTIVRAILAVGALPRAYITITNEIPLGKGLGSSAAAIVLGITIAARLHKERISQESIEQLAVQLEGHPENALAALYGGIVIAADRTDASPSFVRLPAPTELLAAVTVPALELSTAAARALLPSSYSRADLIFTAQRAALLAASLARGEWAHLREAMRDRSHQPHRVGAIPGLRAALELSNDGVLGIALSGAGPSVLALTRDARASECVARQLANCFANEDISSESFHLRIAERGAMVGLTGFEPATS